MPRDCSCFDLSSRAKATPKDDILTHMIMKHKIWRPGVSRDTNIVSGLQQDRFLRNRRWVSPKCCVHKRPSPAYASPNLVDFVHATYEPTQTKHNLRDKRVTFKVTTSGLAGASLCYFGKQFCEIVGPCANCALVHRRNAILRKHSEAFPDIEVTAQRLVAPSLSEIISLDLDAQKPVFYEPGGTVLKLPELKQSVYKYMRKVAGSGKEKKKKFYPQTENTMKTYIEIRLPKV